MCSNSDIDISINILKAQILDKTSFAFSPFMISKDLTAVFLGFNDASTNEFIHIFDNGILKPEKAEPEHYSTFVKLFKDINKDESASKLLFSSSMFLSDDHILPSNIDLMQKLEIQHTLLNFNNGKISAEKINTFISQHTDDHINKIISEENINSAANLLIVNGLYFFSEWETPFVEYFDCLWYSHEDIKLRRIERMMTRTNYNEVWNLTEGDIWRCLGIPFKGRKMWFHIILPKKRFGLATVLEQFNANLLRKCIDKKPSGKIRISLPIFHMVNKFSLMESLSKLGMNNVFEGVINSKYVKLDNIFHGAGININQFNLPERDNSNFVYEDQKDEALPGFCAASPFIYFVTLVENDVNELQNLLLLGTFYGSH